MGSLDPAELRERLGHVGDHVAASEAAGVHAATAGLLWLVDALRRDAASASVTLRVDSLEPTARALLLARTIGGVNPPVVEAATLATDLEGVVAAAEALIAEGLLTDRGGPPPPLVSQIVADSVGVSETAAVATALDAARGAAGLLGQDALTARRTLESGDDLSASSHAELVLHADSARPADREMATAVAVALLAARGLHERAAALAAGAATSADPPCRRLAAIAALEEVLAGGSPRPRSRHADGDGGLADQALMEAAAALDACSSGSPDQGLRLMSEVVSLVELMPPSLPWPDAPHALATLGALAAIDLSRAAQFAQRAVDGRAVSAAERRRMLLLAAWVDVRAGRLKRAVEAVRVESITECSPRDQLVIAAVEVAVARRSGDVAQLTECWTRAKPVLLAARPDLTNLAAIGELAAAATRLGAHEAARPVLETATGLLESAGQPAFWALLFRWDEMQAAAAAGDNEGALALTEAIAAMEVHLPAHRVVQEASAVWASLLDEAPDAARVTEAAEALGGIGLAWEATFLVGQAAIRSTDSRMTRTLLGRAREMKGTVGAEPERLAADTGLSDRELEIALLVRDGLTHKEIGERLFISPKTVEHHVARIRQKLGATTRAEMLAAIALMAR